MELSSERLRFLPHVPENLGRLVRWQTDRELLHLSDDDPEPSSEERVRAALERWIAGARDDMVHLAIHFAETGEPIGFAQIAFVDRRHRRCKLSIVIGERAFWGRGLGTEAIRRLCAYCFDELDMNRIAAETFAYNERSNRAFEAVGFRREGVLRESVLRDDGWHDEYVYGLLRREWRP